MKPCKTCGNDTCFLVHCCFQEILNTHDLSKPASQEKLYELYLQLCEKCDQQAEELRKYKSAFKFVHDVFGSIL